MRHVVEHVYPHLNTSKMPFYAQYRAVLASYSILIGNLIIYILEKQRLKALTHYNNFLKELFKKKDCCENHCPCIKLLNKSL